MTTTAFPLPTILHLALRDPMQLMPGVHSWRCPEGESLFFKRSTLWGHVRLGHSDAEASQLLAQAEQIRQDILDRALKNPIISSASDAPVNVDWVNEQEKERARLVQFLLEASQPIGEEYCFLIDRSGVGTLGRHKIDFPTALYIDVINVGSPEDLSRLNSRLGEWLGNEELEDLTNDWDRLGRDPVGEGWSWFGDWETFQAQQNELRQLFEGWRKGSWNPQATELLVKKLNDRQIVPTDRYHWLERAWTQDRSFWNDAEIYQLDRWTGKPRSNAWDVGISSQYRFVPEETVVLHGIWALVFWELDRDMRHQSISAQCPACYKFLPYVRNRHRARLCEECRLIGDRERKSRWARVDRQRDPRDKTML